VSIGGRCLNPDNEVRRLFGSRVVQADQRSVYTNELFLLNLNDIHYRTDFRRILVKL